jgi:S-DNA-T family DNA segregation ATPase FtsK/SpoIIIE
VRLSAASKKPNGTSRSTGQSRSRSTGATRRQPTKPAPKQGGLDDRSRRDIYGVVLSVLAIALAVAVARGSEGVVSDAIAQAFRLGFGIGAYIIPVVVLLWGVSFFVRVGDISEGRVGLGLALTVLAIISIAAVRALQIEPADAFWSHAVLSAYGGYVGAAVASALHFLVGNAISYVLLVGLLVVGLVVTGLSISGLIEWARERMAGAPAETTSRTSRGRERVPRTTPLDDAEEYVSGARPSAAAGAAAGDASNGVAERGATIRRARDAAPGAPDPGKTVPLPAAAAPRAMEGFDLPPFSMLKQTSESASSHRASEKELQATARVLEDTLATFDIPCRVVDWIPGPTVTLFEIDIAKGVKVGRITPLADDLALALAASTVRILAPIPGKSLIGVEVPNERRAMITLGDVLAGSPAGQGSPLLLGIGKDVSGNSVVQDLAPMPHILIAGSTGTGKSVCINAILVSLLMRSTPAEVRLILIDPKRIELSLYNGVPHLYVPVVTEPKEAASALAWAVSEMDGRLKKMQKAGARNIGMFNALVQEGRAPEGAQEMPYLVIVIDELADLMMVAAKEVEDSICRLAQLARAAGIHLVVATQRPSTDIITGLIKTNIVNRIAFAVASSIDSRVILDQPGAEKLVGKGDMLFSMPEWHKPKRIQGAFVTEDEISAVVDHLKSQGEPDYHEEILHLKVSTAGAGGVDTGEDDDPLLWEAADIVVTTGIGSTSLLQRRLKVGYARAGRIMDMLEAKGVVGMPDGSKPREVLVDVEELESVKAFERRDAEEQGYY